MSYHHRRTSRSPVFCVATCFAVLCVGSSATAALINDFQSGTTEGWKIGPAGPQPTILTDGGPSGVGDHALRIVSDGEVAAGRMVVFNSTDWTGNYITRGIFSIEGVMRASSTTASTLTMRAAIDGPGGRFATTYAITLPTDFAYHEFNIPVTASDFTSVGGANINATLASVSTLRLLHNPVPDWRGVNVEATLDLDSGPLAAAAVNFEWATATNGDFEVAGNWTQPFGPPSNASDNALFNKTGSYAVFFPEFGLVRSGDLRVTDGNVTFQTSDSGDAIYQVAIDAEITGGDLSVGGLLSDPLGDLPLPVNLQIADDLIVHHSDAAGISTMTIGFNSTVTVADVLIIGAGSVSTGDGAVTVAGSPSGISTLDVPTGLINLGGFGNTGTLHVLNDAQANLATTSGRLQIGDSGFDDTVGELLVSNGGSANTGHIEVTTIGSGAIGTITVSNNGLLEQTLAGANLTLGSTSGTGSATMNVQENGTFTTSTGTTAINTTGTVNIGLVGDGTFNANGDVNIVGFGAALHVGSSVFDEFNLANGKTLTASGGGLVDFEGSYNVTGDTTFAINTGATFMAADLDIGGASGTGTLIIDGSSSTLTQFGAATLSVGSASGTGSATINVQNGGTLNAGTGSTTINATGTVNLSGGALNATTIDFTGGGQFNFTGGTLSVKMFDGDLTNQGGTLAPGSSAGITTVNGVYEQQAGATLEIELGGNLAVSEYDLVSITGNALLDGELELSLINSFIPDPTDRFTVLGGSSIVGIFSNVTTGQRLDTLDGGGSFIVNYGFGSAFAPNELVLSDFLMALTADFDSDGDIDGADFLKWQRGETPDLGSAEELALWETQFGSTVPAVATVVPELSTLLLASLACMIIGSSRRRV